MNESRTRRSPLWRGLGILAAVVVAAGAISPAFSAFNPTKANIKKIAKKEAVKQINKLAPGLSVATSGNGGQRISFRGGAGTTMTTIFNAGGLVLKAECVAGLTDDLGLTMESTVNNAAVFADSHDHDGSGNNDSDTSDTYEQQGDFDAGQPVVIDGDNLHADDGQGLEINYSNPNGTEVFVKLHNWLADGTATAPADCFVGGIAFVV